LQLAQEFEDFDAHDPQLFPPTTLRIAPEPKNAVAIPILRKVFWL
jgi:hypothetical protein